MAINDLTRAETAEVEKLSGQPLTDMFNGDSPKGKLAQSIVFVLKKREDPKYTMEQAGTLTWQEMNDVIGEDPTSG